MRLPDSQIDMKISKKNTVQSTYTNLQSTIVTEYTRFNIIIIIILIYLLTEITPFRRQRNVQINRK